MAAPPDLAGGLGIASRPRGTRAASGGWAAWLLGGVVAAHAAGGAAPPGGPGPPGYHSIDARLAGTTIVLTGEALSVDELLKIARFGAKVTLSAAALQRESDNYGLLLEAQAEGVPVYLLNRGGGLARSVTILEGDPLSAENKALIERREAAAFESGALMGDGPEVDEEEVVRAAMAVRANQMVKETPSPQLAQTLLDLLNDDVTPVMQSRGSAGESDYNLLPNLEAVMVGHGTAYHHGVRMSAASALQAAGIAPLKPSGVDSSTFANSNAYTTALAAILVVQGRHVLEWADMAYAMDLNGMNSSITPISTAAQIVRPFRWINWDATRVMAMLKGSYLLGDDPQRLLADPDSLRASAIRQGAAWQAWAALRDSVELQMNSSDHNPAVALGLSPKDSWELSSPQMMKYFVKGGRYSHGQHGYIVSTANWDPYPLVNDVEGFTNALTNLAALVTQRIYRFNNPFFTVLKPADVIASSGRRFAQSSPILVADLWQELQVLAAPVPPAGLATDVEANGDIQSQARLKASRGLAAIDVFTHLLAQDVLTGGYWMNLRLAQNPTRSFGPAADAALAGLREAIAWDVPDAGSSPRLAATAAYEFVRDTPAARFFAQADIPIPPSAVGSRPRDDGENGILRRGH